MKVTVPMLFVICFAVAGGLMAGSGFNDAVGIDKATGLQDDADQLSEDASSYRADRGGSVESYLGFTTQATGAIVGALKWSLMLPLALQNVGFPAWFAGPIGVPIQFVNYIGVWQIIRGMNIV